MAYSLTRRGVLGAGASLAAVSLLAPSALLADDVPRSLKARRSLHIWLPGGWPATEMWDPKQFTPFRAGMTGRDLLSTCDSIPTSAPSIRLGAGLEELAPFMHRATVIRSLVPDEPNADDALDHAAAQRRMLAALTFDQMDLCDWTTAESSRAANQHTRITLPFTPYQNLDAHEFGARESLAIKRIVGEGLAAMLASLSQDAEIDRTIVCISSEFSRTIAGVPPRGSDVHTGENTVIHSERDYGLHRHFAGSNSLVLLGGPFQGGRVIGRTRDHHPMLAVEQPVTLTQVRAMLQSALA